jgi:hypothetical protein
MEGHLIQLYHRAFISVFLRESATVVRGPVEGFEDDVEGGHRILATGDARGEGNPVGFARWRQLAHRGHRVGAEDQGNSLGTQLLPPV